MRTRFFVLAALLCILGCPSCDQRDPEAEYQDLSLTAFNPQDGMDKAQEYMTHFQKNRFAHIQEAREIYYEYASIQDFDRKTYYDLAELIEDGQELDQELSMSQSPGVRRTWSSLYKEKRKRTQQYILDSLNEIRFSPELSRAAREICAGTYMTWDVESVSEISIGPAELVEDGTAKRCSAEYQVYLRGNIVGRRTYNARVSASGRYSFDSMGHLHFTLEDSHVIDGPATAGEWAEGLMNLMGN